MALANKERLVKVCVLRHRVQNVQCCAVLREYKRTDDAHCRRRYVVNSVIHQAVDGKNGGFSHDGFSRQFRVCSVSKLLTLERCASTFRC